MKNGFDGGKERFRILAAFATGIIFCISCIGGAAFAFQDEGILRIGSIESLTGIPSPYGIQALNGMKIAIDKINAAGGVSVAGKKVKLQIVPQPNGYDTGNDSPLVIALMKKQVLDDKVLAIVGPTSSGSTEVAFNYLNQLAKDGNPIVLLSAAAGAPNLGGISPWGFRNMFFENQIFERELSMLAKQFGYKTAAMFVVTNNAYTAAMAKFVIKPSLERNGFSIVAETEGLAGDTDLSRQVQMLQQQPPDVVFVSATLQATVSLMKEAARRGLKPRIWLGTVGSIAPELPQLGGTAVERFVVGSSYSPGDEAVQGLRAEYQKRYSQEINLFGVNGYEAMFILKAAIESAGVENRPDSLAADRKKLREALLKTEIKSVTGETIKFNSKGDAMKQGYLLTIKNGQFVVWDGKAFQ